MTTTKDKLRIINMKKGNIVLPTKSETKQQQIKDRRRKEAERKKKLKKKQEQKKRQQTEKQREDKELMKNIFKNLNIGK